MTPTAVVLRVAWLIGTLVLVSVSSASETPDAKSGVADDEPKTWRAALGDICQLPSFPRATADPQRYVECVRQTSFAATRQDLGIWLLRECLTGYEFVASARRCKTARSVVRQQLLCDGPNATSYQFCPSAKAVNEFVVTEQRQGPRECTCPNGELNCVCAQPEVLEPVAVPRNSNARRRAPQASSAPYFDYASSPSYTEYASSSYPPQTQTPGLLVDISISGGRYSQYPACPCSQKQPDCTCVMQSSQGPQLANNQCCQPQQSPPCACQPAPDNCQTTTTGQMYCPQQQQPAVVQPQPCPLVQGQSVANAQYQGICSWMIDPLATDPQSCNHYLQCQPAPNNLFCGRWQRMPCAPGTKFDFNSQVCVWDSQGQPGALPTPAPYSPPQRQPSSSSGGCSCTGGVQIGACNQNYQCPGQSVCQVGQQNGQPCMVCCYFRKAKKHAIKA